MQPGPKARRKRTPKPKPGYDRALKELLLAPRDAFLALIAPGVRWVDTVSEELPAGARRADLVWLVEDAEGRRFLLPIELQVKLETDKESSYSMHIQRVHRLEAAQARGIVIVIDVIRAFSVAAYAFAGGARAIWLVRSVEEAFALREREPSALLAGEVGGRLIAGFDFNNSPSGMAAADVRGKLLIQRTGAGTQGAVNAAGAVYLLPCSLVTARATAAYARRLAETTGEIITLMPTESVSKSGARLLEDTICADYLQALLLQQSDAAEVLADGLHRLRDSGRLNTFQRGESDFPAEDVPAFLAADRFTFVMQGTREQWNGITYIHTRRVEPGVPFAE